MNNVQVAVNSKLWAAQQSDGDVVETRCSGTYAFIRVLRLPLESIPPLSMMCRIDKTGMFATAQPGRINGYIEMQMKNPGQRELRGRYDCTTHVANMS